jgi:hypothetical protein
VVPEVVIEVFYDCDVGDIDAAFDGPQAVRGAAAFCQPRSVRRAVVLTTCHERVGTDFLYFAAKPAKVPYGQMFTDLPTVIACCRWDYLTSAIEYRPLSVTPVQLAMSPKEPICTTRDLH